jgi:site-specific DNA-adenine methylase
MGSKRKSAGLIYQTIKNLNPNQNILVDLFCGGFSISEYFIKQKWQVIANDKNKYVVDLINQTFSGLPNEKITQFVSREKFQKVLGNPDHYANWYVGYLMCVWSFGNNQKNYLYGKKSEQIKRASHELVINKNLRLIKKLKVKIPKKYLKKLLNLDSWHKRRLALRKIVATLKNKHTQHKTLLDLKQLQHLERLEHLQQLHKLKNNIIVDNKDYKNVKIPKEAIVYCDPPYKNTSSYAVDDFNHAEFWEYVRKLSRKYPVYVSEYQAPNDFKKVLEFQQGSTLQGGFNKSQPNECLFVLKNNE